MYVFTAELAVMTLTQCASCFPVLYFYTHGFFFFFFGWLLLLYIGNGVRSCIVVKQSGSFSKLFSKSCIQN